jgi:hypothetical protein
LRLVPSDAWGWAVGTIDFEAVLAAVRDLVPVSEQTRLDDLLLALRGILLGQDLPSALLPHLGPGLLVALDAPAATEPAPVFPRVAVLELGSGPGAERVAAALDNALRTLLAVYALDEKHGGGRLRVESRAVSGTTITALAASTPYAYAISRGRLVVGSSAAVVARASAKESAPGKTSRFDQDRAADFPQAQCFAWFDLEALRRHAAARRTQLARTIAARHHCPERDVARDLDDVLALMSLFRGAFAAGTVDPDGKAVHGTLGLIARDPSASPRP